jgi:transposase-like protein
MATRWKHTEEFKREAVQLVNDPCMRITRVE